MFDLQVCGILITKVNATRTRVEIPLTCKFYLLNVESELKPMFYYNTFSAHIVTMDWWSLPCSYWAVFYVARTPIRSLIHEMNVGNP